VACSFSKVLSFTYSHPNNKERPLATKIRTTTQLTLSLCLTLFTISCGGLPKNFSSLPLEKQVDAYKTNFARHGGSLIEAQEYISWHGRPAADLMAEYLVGARTGLPKGEAINIIHDIQTRGCSLKGTSAERALKDFLTKPGGNLTDIDSARDALHVIDNDIVTPTRSAFAPYGPCEAARQKRSFVNR
jgi:hypothetical protein